MSIIAAVDRSERADSVVEEAATLARAFDVEVHVLHVLSVGEFVELEQTSVDTTDEVLDVDDVRDVAATIAERATDHLDQPHTTVGRVGDAATEIRQYATEQDAAYVVLSPRKRSPAGKAIFGSVAQDVVLDAPCPVVTTVH